MTDFEQQAREIARAICVEYRLSPEAYERQGVEHPLIPVLARHIASALADADRKAREECAGIAERKINGMGGATNDLTAAGVNRAARQIAAAIRATIPAQGGGE